MPPLVHQPEGKPERRVPVRHEEVGVLDELEPGAEVVLDEGHALFLLGAAQEDGVPVPALLPERAGAAALLVPRGERAERREPL